MADDLLPISDEQAKALQEGAKLGVKALEILDNAGGWISDVLGDVPKNLVGVLGGDRLRHYRENNLRSTAEKARERLRRDEVTEPQRVSLAIALPLLQATAEESRPELQDLWVRLLANAMDPKRGMVRLSFIEAVKKFDPLDALVLQKLRGGETWQPNKRDAYAQQLEVPSNQIEVSFLNLDEAKCLNQPSIDRANPNLSAFGSELLRALE